MLEPLKKALWANRITRICLEECNGDVEAALSAAEIIVSTQPMPDEVEIERDDCDDEGDPPLPVDMSFAVRRAPKGGIDIGGEHFPGGEFIPDDAWEKGTDEEKASYHTRILPEQMAKGKKESKSERSRKTPPEPQSKQQVEWESSLSKRDKDVFKRWTREATDVGAGMLGDDYPIIRHALNKAPEHKGEIYRGINFYSHSDKHEEVHQKVIDALLTPGSEVVMGKMASWSKDLNIAGSFAGPIGKVTISTNIVLSLSKRKNKAVDITNLAHKDYKHQKEVIVDGYNGGKPLKYKVISVKDEEIPDVDFESGKPTGTMLKVKRVQVEEI